MGEFWTTVYHPARALEHALKPASKVAVTGVVGMAGIGKTELAKLAAHRLAGRSLLTQVGEALVGAERFAALEREVAGREEAVLAQALRGGSRP